MWKNVLHVLKTNKLLSSLLIICIILLLSFAALRLADEETKEPNNSSSITGYESFTEKEQKEGEMAVKLAEEQYKKDFGDVRDSSFFYAELRSQDLYHVIGVDELDGRDVTFIEYDVDLRKKTVTESETIVE